jgi:hypothetical protein
MKPELGKKFTILPNADDRHTNKFHRQMCIIFKIKILKGKRKIDHRDKV